MSINNDIIQIIAGFYILSLFIYFYWKLHQMKKIQKEAHWFIERQLYLIPKEDIFEAKYIMKNLQK